MQECRGWPVRMPPHHLGKAEQKGEGSDEQGEQQDAAPQDGDYLLVGVPCDQVEDEGRAVGREEGGEEDLNLSQGNTGFVGGVKGHADDGGHPHGEDAPFGLVDFRPSEFVQEGQQEHHGQGKVPEVFVKEVALRQDVVDDGGDGLSGRQMGMSPAAREFIAISSLPVSPVKMV